jgi:hypothetical protein
MVPLVVACALSLCACTDGGSGTSGAVAPADIGVSADAGTADAGTDAGLDAGLVCRMPEAGFAPVPLDADPVFVKGPYLMYTSTTSAVVMWETREASSSTVEYGPTEALGSSATGVEKGAPDGDSGTVHEVTVDGLEPGARYFYRAGDGTTWSAVHTLGSAPPPATPFRFAALSDTQSHPEIHARLVPLMAQWGSGLVLHAGDVVGDGTVVEQWQTEFYDPIRPLAHRVPYFMAIGNHEKSYPLFRRFVSYPTAEESYYTFVWGDVFFIAIDSNRYLLGALDPQHEWIRRQLRTKAAKAAKWRVAFVHEPAFFESWGSCTFAGNPVIRRELAPILEEGGVNVVINGDVHAYERGVLNGVTHVITGGGGGDLDEDWCVDYPHITVRRPVHNFLAFEASCDALSMQAIDVDGNVFDSFAIPPGLPVAPDGGTDTDGRVVWDAGAPHDAGEADAGFGGDT